MLFSHCLRLSRRNLISPLGINRVKPEGVHLTRGVADPGGVEPVPDPTVKIVIQKFNLGEILNLDIQTGSGPDLFTNYRSDYDSQFQICNSSSKDNIKNRYTHNNNI